MCGIAGCLALALEADPDQAWLTEALDRIHHRGPDDDGVYTDPDVALGFRRLSILDLSLAGHQPMKSADGRFWMIFNGEIYNYVEMGAELREQGVTLRSNGDAEVLLETYALVGKDGAREDWFTPAARSARQPGRHAAGEPDGLGVLHKEAARGDLPHAAAPAPAGAAEPALAGLPGPVDLRLRFASERKALAEPG